MRARRALLALAGLAITAVAGAAERRAAVVDPAFGETLYAFYQKQYFDAISRLLVARERGELKRQAAEGELLLGGLYVQYGVPGAAQDIFATLLPGAGDSPQVQKIWLALAELNYRRGNFEETVALVARHFPRPSAAASPESAPPEQAVMLAVKSLMRLGRYAEATAWLGPRISDLPESRYLRFNIAVARIGNGEADAGAAMLEELLAAPAGDDEFLALRDRVALALAATRLQQLRAPDALQAISAARLDGPYSNEALLVYGISALESGRAPAALGALVPLAGRDPHDGAVQEGWVALAKAYDAAGDARRSLAAYRKALKLLDGEMHYLQQQEDGIVRGDWFAALERRAQDIALRDDRVGLSDADVLGMPLHYRMFAGNRFVMQFGQYVEVSRLARLAVDWQQRIPVMDYLVQSRTERHERIAVQARALLDDTPTARYAARQDDLASAVRARIDSDDPAALATAEQRRLLDFAAQAARRMEAWPQRDWSAQQQKLALLRGNLDWQLVRDRPARAWELRRAVRDNGRLVDDSAALRQRVAKAAGRQVASVTGWRQALTTEETRLKDLATRSAGLRDALRKGIEADAVQTVRDRREMLVQLAADSWFGIAQLEHGAWRDRRDAARAARETAPADPVPPAP